MTPTPREDTMAEQTDQIIERMRTRAMVAGQCSVEAPDNVHSSMAAAEAEFLTECADLLAAQVRERDAAILRYQTAELEQNAVIARLGCFITGSYWDAIALRSSPTMPPEWPPKPSQADIDRLEKAAWDSGTEAVLVWYRDEIERLKAERS